jgi:signal transduction histidine kinase
MPVAITGNGEINSPVKLEAMHIESPIAGGYKNHNLELENRVRSAQTDKRAERIQHLLEKGIYPGGRKRIARELHDVTIQDLSMTP